MTLGIDEDIVILVAYRWGKRCLMLTVKVSPKFQVVIPKEIRESLHVLPGQRMQVVQYENRIELILERDVGELEGFLQGISTGFEREKDRL